MTGLSDSPSRKELLEFISKSSSYGNLGAFIGAGFSKAVLNDPFQDIALSWGELLEKVAETLAVDYGAIWKEGVGYPEIASQICVSYSEAKGKTYEASLQRLKQEIAKLTSWYPDKDQRAKYSKHLMGLGASWIITTNYDLVIESLLTGASVPLGPNDSFSAPNGVIPVYHLHGIRTNPDEIIIAQEDYVGLFRPAEYRQLRLALLIKESTVVVLGYGLGDVNVLTALDWSRNVFGSSTENYPNEVVQIIRAETPKDDPYRDRNGILVVETPDVEVFFDEYRRTRRRRERREKKRNDLLSELANRLDATSESMLDKFIDDVKFREGVLDALSKHATPLVAGFVSFLNAAIDKTWERSKPDGAFQGYADNLSMILDILMSFNVGSMPPALFETAGYALHRVGYYVGDELGKSFEAKRIWDRRKSKIDESMVEELRAFAEQHRYYYLERLCKDAVA